MSLIDGIFALAVLTLLLVAVTYWGRFSAVLSPAAVDDNVEIDREVLELQEKKDHLLEDLRDLELDFRMGKIAEDEYRQRKARVEPKTVAVIKELEALGVRLSPLDELADDELDDIDNDLYGVLDEPSEESTGV